jgi:hypothetical protein
MKLAILALTLLLLVVPSYHSVNRQKLSGAPQDPQGKNAELLRLEAKFKQIDKESDPVKVKVTGEEESSGTVNISVERVAPVVVSNDEAAKTNPSKKSEKENPGKTEETLLDIDLSTFNVPDEYVDAKIKEVFSTETRCGTLPGVVVSQVGVGANYVVVKDYIYEAGPHSITVLKGFPYDRASIPRIFWVLIDKDSLGNVAPLLHDLLYRHGGVLPTNQVSPYRRFSRLETDDLFLEIATKCGVKRWRRELAYQAVRNFGGSSWKSEQ